jgi:hypothetical protein
MLTPEGIRSPQDMRALLEEAEELYRHATRTRTRVARRLYAWARWRRSALLQSTRDFRGGDGPR